MILLFSGVHHGPSRIAFIAMIVLAVLPSVAVGIDAKRHGLPAVSITGVVLKSVVVTLGMCALAFATAFVISVFSGHVTFE